MKCFYYFKFTLKGRGQRSAPELKEQEKSQFSGSERVTKSSCSSTSSPRGIPKLYEEKGHNLRVFSFSELRRATSDFNRLLKIGEGGFGSVFKGSIKPVDGNGENVVVAIKRLNKDALQGHKQWLTEVQFLGVVEHPNLVKLIGYCALDGERGIQRLLVYEYMPNRSLEAHLFNKAYDPVPWKTRLEIALGAAQGLSYLHEEIEVQVIYRDFKCSNVLLDENFKPKLSDFGLAREGPVAGDTHVSTAVMGTHGYAAPDYIETGHLTSKSDVWSFGVVLYEILTGRRSLARNRPKTEQKLLEWVKNYPPDSKKFDTIMDPRLEGQYSINAARKIAKLADHCLRKSAKDRPPMSQVVERLKQIIQESDEEQEQEKEQEKETKIEIVSSLSLLVGLLRLVRDKKHQNGILIGLTLLKKVLSCHESIRNSLISIGAIPQLIEILPSLSNECLEIALYILEILSTLEEGKLALKECPNIIPNVVKMLMRVSENCTQFALSILWAIYKLAPEECASKAVEAGLASKLLLVIQSGCNPVLKQMSSEFLKMCSVNYSTSSIFISKCMLTTTIQ